MLSGFANYTLPICPLLKTTPHDYREHLDTAPIMNGCDWFLIREKQQLTVRKDP